MRIVALVLAVGVALGACAAEDPSHESPRVSSSQPAAAVTPSPPSGADPSPPAKRVLFDGTWYVEEGVWNLTSGRSGDKLYTMRARPFAGQANGLLGVGVPGAIDLNPPVLWGELAVRIELLPHRPRLARKWQDVVEVSFTTKGGPFVMGGFDDATKDLRLPAGTYRVRYSARGLDRASRAEYIDEYFDRVMPGRHLFQFWPAPSGPDRIIRRHAKIAEYWHREAPRH